MQNVLREDRSKPYLLELHNVWVEQVAMIHDLSRDILHTTQDTPAKGEIRRIF